MYKTRPARDYDNRTIIKYQLIWYSSPNLRPRTRTSIRQMMQTGLRARIAFTAYGVSNEIIHNGCIVEVTMEDGSIERGRCIGRKTIVMLKRPSVTTH